MDTLSGILPKTQLVQRFGSKLILEEYGKEQLKIIAKKHPGALFSSAASVWNRIVTQKWHDVDPQQFAPYFNDKDPKFHAATSDALGIEVIRDIYYVKGWRKKPKIESNLVVEMLVAWVYKNDLHLADINFLDPDKPLPPEERKSRLQTHKGLGLLPVLLENLQRESEGLGCEQLTLTAGTEAEMNLFESYGFSVEDSEVGRLSRLTHVGYPMQKNVRSKLET